MYSWQYPCSHTVHFCIENRYSCKPCADVIQKMCSIQKRFHFFLIKMRPTLIFKRHTASHEIDQRVYRRRQLNFPPNHKIYHDKKPRRHAKKNTKKRVLLNISPYQKRMERKQNGTVLTVKTPNGKVGTVYVLFFFSRYVCLVHIPCRLQ